MVALVVVMPTQLLKGIRILGEVPEILAGSTMNPSPNSLSNINDHTTLGIGHRQRQISSIHHSARNL
jgi:hypothetical protein